MGCHQGSPMLDKPRHIIITVLILSAWMSVLLIKYHSEEKCWNLHNNFHEFDKQFVCFGNTTRHFFLDVVEECECMYSVVYVTLNIAKPSKQVFHYKRQWTKVPRYGRWWEYTNHYSQCCCIVILTHSKMNMVAFKQPNLYHHWETPTGWNLTYKFALAIHKIAPVGSEK